MKTIFGLILVFVLTLLTIAPLTKRGYFPMHDDTQVGRVVVMGKALRWGQFPVRWVSDLGYGYGYPIYNFYGPLPYYAGGALYGLGLSGLAATKAMMVIGMIGAGLVMYLFAKRLLGFFPAVTAAVLYAYAPYHAVQLYVRGAVGELWTLIFYPLILWGMLPVSYAGKWRMLIGALGIGGVIMSHTLMGYATVMLLLLSLTGYHSLQLMRRRFNFSDLSFHLQELVLGLGVSAFFWLPAVSEMRFTNVAGQITETADFNDHFVCLSQLWNSPWGYGGSTAACLDGMSFILGKLHIILGLVAIAIGIYSRGTSGRTRLAFFLGILVTGLAILFMTPASRLLWEWIPGFPFLQYPWRFLGLAAAGLSLLSAIAVGGIKGRVSRLIITVAIIIVAIGLYAKRFVPQYIYERPAPEFETTMELRGKVSRISDEYLPRDFKRPENKDDFVSNAIPSTPTMKIRSIVVTDTYSRFAAAASEENVVEVKRAYFPGLELFVNGVKQKPRVISGLPTIVVPKGESVIELRLVNTPVRSVANLLTAITMVAVLLHYGKKANA